MMTAHQKKKKTGGWCNLLLHWLRLMHENVISEQQL